MSSLQSGNSFVLKTSVAAHFDQIKRGGAPVALRKLRRLAGRILWLVFWLAAYPVIVLLRPIVLVRFGTIYAGRIGHFAYDVAFYLAERERGKYPPRSLDLFCLRGEISNNYFARLCSRYLWVSDGVRYAIRIYQRIPGSGQHFLRVAASHRYGYRDIEGVLARTPRRVFLDAQEEERGWAELEQRFAVPRNAPIVCLQVRSNAYLARVFGETAREHEYRERNRHKNTDIRTFIPALGDLVAQGHWCFRMGAVADVPLECPSPHVIDYANTGRSEFLDVFLASNCQFFVSTGSGIDAFGDVFRKPIVFCNQVTVEAVHAWLPNVTIFKRLRDKTNGRILTFREIIQSGLGKVFDAREYERRGIELVDNTPDEIRAAVSEMAARVAGQFVEQPEDRERQERFWALLQGSKYQGRRVGWIGASFLSENEGLLA